MKDVNYLIGRLQGLNELVKILKDLAESKRGAQDSEVIRVLADHISAQLTSIISDFESIDVKPKQREALVNIKEKHKVPVEEAAEEEIPSEKLEKHEKTVDDLLRDLESLKS
ncbi:MAG: hypothetical protein ABIN58_13915 [candidate division WOR-3 bacterium]